MTTMDVLKQTALQTQYYQSARHVLMNGHLLSNEAFNIMVETYTQLTVCIIVLVT
jgi:hypothetical protein